MTREELKEHCEDCISRQTVIDVLKHKWNMFSDANDAIQESIDTIEALPPITPTQEPILDKIRAEIRALSPSATAEDVIDGGNPIKEAVGETIHDVLQIIDKYKESEGV